MITTLSGAKEGKTDGFVSTLTRKISILPEGKPLWGRPCQKVEVEEIDVRPIGVKGGEKNDLEDPDAWEAEISRAGRGGAFMFSDGSLMNSGNVGGGGRHLFMGQNARRRRWRPGSVTWQRCGTVRLQVWLKKVLILVNSNAAIAVGLGTRRAGSSPACFCRNDFAPDGGHI